MSDTTNEPFVEFTIPALVESYARASVITVRVCIHEPLHTAELLEGDADLTLRHDPFTPPLGPSAQWQSFAPLALAPNLLRDGAELTSFSDDFPPEIGENTSELNVAPVLISDVSDPIFNDTPSMVVEPASMLGEAPSMVVEPGPMLGEAPSMVVEPASMLGEAPSMVVEPASMLGKAPSMVVEPGPMLGEAPSMVVEPASMLGEAPSMADQPASMLGEAPSMADQPASMLGEVSSMADQPASMLDKTPLMADQPASMLDKTPSMVVKPASMLGEVSSMVVKPASMLGEASFQSGGELPDHSGDFYFAPREADEIAANSALATATSAMALVFDAALDLNEIPIIGGKLPPELTLGLRNLALVWTPSGMAIRPEIYLANAPLRLPLSMLPNQNTFGNDAPPESIDTPSAIKPVFWANINKKLGPLQLDRLGIGFGDEKLWLLMDSTLQLGQVKLMAMGLGLGIDLGQLLSGKFTLPAFQLDGLGVEVQAKSGTKAGGALLRRTTTSQINGQAVEHDVYVGAMVVQTSTMTLTALGSFQAPPGQDPALFAYGTVTKPIGGPPFFFVTGISLGFGINTSFKLPDVDRAHEFPLIRDVQSPNLPVTPDLMALTRTADALRKYQTNAPDTVVLAMGIKGTSFGIINSNLVLLATISQSLHVDLIGQSVLQLPAEQGKQRIADIRVNWRGNWSEDSDKLWIRGQVRPGSWAFHSALQLTGEMAFEAWTRGPHAGDFVFTIGGYAPGFNVPSHYPLPARLAMKWSEKIGDLTLAVKAEGYCAITPSALMVGGALKYSISCGKFEAWYTLEAHFLLQWYPFRYSAKMSLDIGASYTLEVDLGFYTISETFSVEVGADLEIWGPDLGGKVSFELVFIEVSFEFGASNQESPPLSWNGFKSSFLTKEPLALRAPTGIRGNVEINGKNIWIVTPDELIVELETAIPARNLTANGASSTGRAFGVRPMQIDEVNQSTVTIEVTDSHGQRVTIEPRGVERNVPAAQWGQNAESADALLRDVLAGANLSAFGDAYTAESFTTLVERDELINSDVHPAGPSDWASDHGAMVTSGNFEALWVDPTIAATRTALLREMLDLGSDEPDPAIEVRSFWISELQEIPTLKNKLVAS